MNAQVQPTRPARVSPRSPSPTRPAANAPVLDDHDVPSLDRDRDRQVEPLWMITVAGALLFVFLAVAAAFG